jgi:thermostable 8-oxoguanine DNA glycosylase
MSATQIFDNLELIKEKLLKYEKMKTHLKKCQKRYQQTHPEKIREISKRYYDKGGVVRKYHEDPIYREKVLERNRIQREKRKMKKLQEESNLLKET